MRSDQQTVMAAYDEWEAANTKLAALSYDALTPIELLDLQYRREVVIRANPRSITRSSRGWWPRPTPKH